MVGHKSCKCNIIRIWNGFSHVYTWWRKEGMELGKVFCLICQVSYYPGSLMEYGYEGLDPGLKVWYLLNGIRCDKLSTATATVRHVKIGMRRILMLLLPSSVNTLTREPQQLVWRLPLLGRADRPSNRRPALPVSCSKKRLSWRSIPENNMTQCQWHCASSYMTSKKKTRAAGEDRD